MGAVTKAKAKAKVKVKTKRMTNKDRISSLNEYLILHNVPISQTALLSLRSLRAI